MTYISVDEAKARDGVRLVVTRDIPVPWGEAAKSILHVKGIAHDRVAQVGGCENSALEAWTGKFGAPILVCGKEQPLDRWASILVRLEEFQPEPRLIPIDETERTLMFGYIHAVMEPGGYLYSRRLWLNAQPYAENDALPKGVMERLRGRYGANAGERQVRRQIEVLTHLSRRLREQKAAGSRYFMGSGLTALDIYWATACALVKPLPPNVCVMDEGIRYNYTEHLPEVLAAVDPILLEHREYIYEKHLELPLRL